MRMKKLIVFGMLVILLCCTATAYAQIDQLTNMSVEWVRTGNRNAATDSTDIVIYNPAGLTKMSDGWHVNLSNQSLFRSPEHTFDLNLPASSGNRKYEQDSPDYLIPSFFCAYNQEKFSLFGGVYIPGNGAVVDYPDGSINTQFVGAMTVMGSSGMFTSFKNDYLKAESIYLSTEIGLAYALTDQVAIAVGLRYLNAENQIKAGATFMDVGGNEHDWKLRYDEDADGIGQVFGLNIAPTEDLNIGFRYESEIQLNFETDLKRNDFPDQLGLADYKERNRRDFPSMAGIGAAYRFSPQLSTEVDFSWYFQKNADWGKTSNGEDLADLAGDCWCLGGSLAYQMSDTFLFTMGALYTKFEWDDIDKYYKELGAFEVLYTDNWYFGTGFAWEFKKGVTLNFAIGQTFWDDATIEYVQAADNGFPEVEVETENTTTLVALGVDVAF